MRLARANGWREGEKKGRCIQCPSRVVDGWDWANELGGLVSICHVRNVGH